MLNWC